MEQQVQKVGVFLDSSCEEGQDFLLDSLKLFNSSYQWLIWTNNITENLLTLSPSRINIDSNVTIATPGVKLYDIYRIHKSVNFTVTEIGTGENDKLYFIPRPDRRDFNQFKFNASLMMIDLKFNLSNLIPPLLDQSYEPGIDMVRRYGLSLFMHLAEFYNFRMSYVLTNAWGVQLKNGSWDGMVGQVKRGEADFGLAPAKFIIKRYDIIDYIASLQIVRTCFTFLQPKLFGTYKALVHPLDPIVWVCLGVCSLLGVIAFKAVSKHDNTSVCNDNLGGSTLLVISSIAQQGFPDNSYKLSTRLIYISLLFVTFFTAVYYNTAILNGLLLQAPNAIQNVHQLLKSDIKLGLLAVPYILNEIHTLNDSLTVAVRKKLDKIKDPKDKYLNVEEGVAKLKKGQFAFYTEDEAIYTEIMHKMSDAEICSLSEVEKYRPFHVGAIAQDNSPYRELFSRAFVLMREKGLMDRQENRWLVQKPECHWRQDAHSLGLEPLTLAYVIMGLGYILAFAAYIYERWIYNNKNKKLQIKALK
ncbi:glutamate receptor ionotropic, delta-2-like [Cimex lectularius]|uniref:Ionotropic receptor 75a N-terminal domain-containing protein n=1 Tax=Cimex lectularius TaxID=79782 RepID=A0A8I6SK41_CIMLE|nr:glutamate receptor ionotropic, delta-2-like [Cimex lectularius]